MKKSKLMKGSLLTRGKSEKMIKENGSGQTLSKMNREFLLDATISPNAKLLYQILICDADNSSGGC